jgi:hypothetical protein
MENTIFLVGSETTKAAFQEKTAAQEMCAEVTSARRSAIMGENFRHDLVEFEFANISGIIFARLWSKLCSHARLWAIPRCFSSSHLTFALRPILLHVSASS